MEKHAELLQKQVIKEYLRQSQITDRKGKRVFDDDYLIKSLSIRFEKTTQKIKQILKI